ncbi:MAG: MotA/TolQ/ExbB proton channel family protein [Phycisphaerales bacterium]
MIVHSTVWSLIDVTLAQAGPGAASSRTLWQYIKGGGPIGYVIIMLSVAAVALAIVHLLTVRDTRLTPPEVVEGLSRHLRGNDIQGALRFCDTEENRCFVTRVFGQAMTRCMRSPFGFLEMRSALEEAGTTEVDRLGRSTDGIALIAQVAPMLGLLGTVVGMVGGFETISTTEGAARPAQLAGDISIALITTVQGLVVAIPCHALSVYFRNRTQRLALQAGEVIEGLASEIEGAGMGRGGRAPTRPGAARPGVPPAMPPQVPHGVGAARETGAR